MKIPAPEVVVEAQDQLVSAVDGTSGFVRAKYSTPMLRAMELLLQMMNQPTMWSGEVPEARCADVLMRLLEVEASDAQNKTYFKDCLDQVRVGHALKKSLGDFEKLGEGLAARIAAYHDLANVAALQRGLSKCKQAQQNNVSLPACASTWDHYDEVVRTV